jgi:hypothetical protein
VAEITDRNTRERILMGKFHSTVKAYIIYRCASMAPTLGSNVA